MHSHLHFHLWSLVVATKKLSDSFNFHNRVGQMKHLLAITITISALLALTGCDNIVQTASDDVPRLRKIEARLLQKDFDYALPESEKYVQEYPESALGWTQLGWVHVKNDKVEQAQECFEKALGFNPKLDNAHVGKGVTFRALGDNESARKCYLKAISIVPENAEAFSSLLVIEILEGNDEKAVEYGEKSWALRKDLSGIPANLSIAYHYIGDTAKRDEFYKHAERLKYPSLPALQEIFEGEISLR